MGCDINKLPNSNLFRSLNKLVPADVAEKVYVKAMDEVKNNTINPTDLTKNGEPKVSYVTKKYKHLLENSKQGEVEDTSPKVAANLRNPIRNKFTNTVKAGVTNINTKLSGVFGNDSYKEKHALDILANSYNNMKLFGVSEDVIIPKMVEGLMAHYKTLQNQDQKDYIMTIVQDLQDESVNGRKLYNAMLSSSRVKNTFLEFTDLEENYNDTGENTSTPIQHDDTKRERQSLADRIDNEIKQFFNSIPKLNSVSNKEDVYDKTSKLYGIKRTEGKLQNITRSIYDIKTNELSNLSENASFEELYTTILNRAKYSTFETFVNSIADLARDIDPTYSAVYNRMKANPDIARKIYSKFNHIRKQRGTISSRNTEDGVAIVYNDNKNIDEVANAVSNIKNTLRSYATVFTNYDIKSLLDKVNESSRNLGFSSRNYNINKEVLDNEIKNIVSYFKQIGFPISEKAINNYLNYSRSFAYARHNPADQEIYEKSIQLKVLLTNISSAIANTINLKNEYTKAKDNNESINADLDIYNLAKNIKDLVKYTPSRLEATSINIERNMVSDVQPNNYIARIFKLKNENPTGFVNHLKLLNQDKSISFNHLINQVLMKNGMIDETFLDRFNLLDLNGLSNEVNNKKASYTSMTNNDWLFATMLAFTNNSRTEQQNPNIVTGRMASYIIQTPSDAGNTRMIKSIKYTNVDRLIKSDGGINTNHPIYKPLLSIVHQELARIIEANKFMFEYDSNGNLVYENNKPKINELNRKNFITTYHYNAKTGNIFDSNNKVTGRAFKFIELNIDENNSLNEMLSSLFNKFGLLEQTYIDSTSLVKQIDDIVLNNQNIINNYLVSFVNSTLENAEEVYSSIINNDDYVLPWINKKELKQEKQNIRKEYNKTKIKEEDTNKIEKRNLIHDLAINYVIAYNDFNTMFNGSSAFYSSNIETVKRRKQIIAGGYTNAAFTDGVAPIHNGTFKYVTLKDIVLDSNDVAAIESNLIKNGYNEQQAKDIASAYKNINIADAQSYITLDEFERRMELKGDKNKYENTIYAIRNNLPFDRNTMEHIKVQKNFYYKYGYNPNTGLAEAVQIKNAELVLQPNVIKGTKLEELYNWMVANNIGQANYRSAEKVVSHNILDFNLNTDLSTINADDYVNIGDYSYLYMQQEVPSHSLDATNKAVMQTIKKIIENSNNKAAVTNIIKMQMANIEESSLEILDELGIEHDNGNLHFDENNFVKIDMNRFLSRIKDEFSDRGLNSNYMDYVNIDPNTGETYMPMFDNRVRDRMISVLNSLFTNNVTSQKLSGGHYAQISNAFTNHIYQTEDSTLDKLKFNNVVLDENGKIVAGEVEVYLPYWSRDIFSTGEDSFKLTDEELLAKLDEAELLKQFGYRMPTEGKQSMVVFKVKGFLPQSMGDTIMLPDDFVAKTGSDFDVDSVYTINYKHRIIKHRNEEGEVVDISFKKIDYIKGTDESSTKQRYARFIQSQIDADTRKEFKQSVINEHNEEISDLVQHNFDRRKKLYGDTYGITDDVYNEYNNKIQTILKKDKTAFRNLPRSIKSVYWAMEELHPETKGLMKSAMFNAITEQLIEEIESNNIVSFSHHLLDLPSLLQKLKVLEGIESELIEIQYFKDEYIKEAKQSYKDNITEFNRLVKGIWREARQETQDIAKEAEFEVSKLKAESLGLISYEDFAKLPVEKQNSRTARNNYMLDNIFEIMQDSNAYGEYMGTSNFVDMLAARELVESLIGETNKFRNPNLITNQSYWRNQAISGRQLKSFSVARDSMLSIFSMLKVELSNMSFEHIVSLPVEEMKTIYGEENLTDLVVDDKGIATAKVKFNRLGWNNNNNISYKGQKITQYSSQTTANILDNVKDPIFATINEYTFGAFKTMVDIGVSYETATLYFGQPIMFELLRQYDRSNSIFVRNAGKFIESNTRNEFKKQMFEILMETKELPKNLNKYAAIIRRGDDFIVRREDLQSMDEYLELDYTKISPVSDETLKEYIKEGLNEEKSLDFYRNQLYLFDNIQNLFNIDSLIRSYQGVMSTDKKGAGETFEITKNYYKNIVGLKLRNNEDVEEIQDLVSDGVSLIDRLYPGDADIYNSNVQTDGKINLDYNAIRNQIDNAAYPLLISNLVYSNTFSYVVNSNRFITESYGMKIIENNLGEKYSQNVRNKLHNYVTNYLYDVPFMYRPVIGKTSLSFENETQAKYYNYRRINGLGFDFVDSFDFANDKASFEKWLQITPANKLHLIKNHFNDIGDVETIFDYLNSEISETNHKIAFINNSMTNSEIVFSLFNEIYYNNNPYLREFARDLVRYSYIKEGFSFGYNNVSKMLPNNVFTSRNDEDGGIIDIVTSRARMFNDISTFSDLFSSDHVNQLVDSFIRANSYDTELVPVYEYSPKDGKGEVKNVIELNSYKARNEKGVPFGHNIMLLHNNSYSKITGGRNSEYIRMNPTIKDRQTVLYKVVEMNNSNYKILLPVNKLDRFEYEKNSSNPNNNVEAEISTYEAIIREAAFEESIKNFKNIGENKTEDTNTETKVFESSIDDIYNSIEEAVNTNNEYVAIFPQDENLINTKEGEVSTVVINDTIYEVTNLGVKYKNDIDYADRLTFVENQSWDVDDTSRLILRVSNHGINEDVYDLTNEDKELQLRDYLQKLIIMVNRQSKFISDDNLKSFVEALGNLGLYINADLSNPIELDAVRMLAVLRENYIYFNNIISKFDNNFLNNSKYNTSSFYKNVTNSKDEMEAMNQLLSSITQFMYKFDAFSALDYFTSNKPIYNQLNNEIRKIKALSAQVNNVRNFRNRTSRLYLREVITKESTDPRVKEGLLDILDNLNDDNFFQKWTDTAADSYENFISVSVKLINRELQLSSMDAETAVNNFKIKRDKIFNDYKSRTGRDLTIEDIIDADEQGNLYHGFLPTRFSASFYERSQELRQTKAAAKLKYGEYSKEFIKASQNYDDFINRFVERKEVYEYVQAKLEVKQILESNLEAKRLYDEIYSEMRDISREKNMTGIPLTIDEYRQINELKTRLSALRSADVIVEDDNGIRRVPKTGKDAEIAKTLRDYDEARKQFNEKYNETIVDDRFKTTLQVKLNILKVESPTSDAYVEAKQWINSNTVRTFSDEVQDVLEEFKYNNLEDSSEDVGSASAANVFIDSVTGKRTRLTYDEDGELIPYVFINKWDEGNTKYLDQYRREIHMKDVEPSYISDIRPYSAISNQNNVVLNSSYYEDLQMNNNKYGTELTDSAVFISYQREISKWVKKINAIYNKHITPSNGLLNSLTITEPELVELKNLYRNLNSVKTKAAQFINKYYANYAGMYDIEQGSQWFKDNHEFVTNTQAHEEARNSALRNYGEEFVVNYWDPVFSNVIYVDGKQIIEPGDQFKSLVFNGDDSYINFESTKSLEDFRNTFNFVPTKYYVEEYNRQLAKSEDEFQKWYNANHIRNPYTNKVSPLSFWTTMKPKNLETGYKYEPTYEWKKFVPKQQYHNDKYNADRKGFTPSETDKKTGEKSPYINKRYNDIMADPDKAALYNLVSDTVDDISKNAGAQSIRDNGILPSIIKPSDRRMFNSFDKLKERAGWFDIHNDIFADEFGNPSYRIKLDMLNIVGKSDPKPAPERLVDETDEQFATRVAEVNKYNRELRQLNKEEHGKHIITDYDRSIEQFIKLGASFARRNKAAQFSDLVSLHLENANFVKRDGKGKLIVNRQLERFGIRKAKTESKNSSKHLIEHWKNFVESNVYNQFEIDEGTVTKAARVLSNMTSSRYMWLNLLGGINNVTIGTANMRLERYAGQFFSHRHRLIAEKQFWKDIASVGMDILGNEKAKSRTTELIHLFDVLNNQRELGMSKTDYSGLSKERDFLNKFNEAMYMPQSLGEYYMQHSILLTMLESHKLINGKPTNFYNYSIENRRNVLLSMLNEAEKAEFNRYYKLHIGDDKYKYLRKDIIEDWIRYQFRGNETYSNSEFRKEYVRREKEVKKELKATFEEHPSFSSYFSYDSASNSLVYDKEIITPEMIVDFKYKVEAVNKHIHGIYDKFGANMLQRYAIGRLAIQFKKHMKPGWNKRFGAKFGKGYWNEAREVYEKPMYVAFWDYMVKPFKAEEWKNAGEEQKYNMAFMQIVKSFFSYYTHFKLNYDLLSEHDKAGVMRTMVEIFTLVAAIALLRMVQHLAPDDDETTIWDANIYLLDRLWTEVAQFAPYYGWENEGKKLWKRPLASITYFEDMSSFVELTAQWMIDGEEPVYETGSLAGKGKVSYRLEKMIPVYNQYLKWVNLNSSNRYYKLR